MNELVGAVNPSRFVVPCFSELFSFGYGNPRGRFQGLISIVPWLEKRIHINVRYKLRNYFYSGLGNYLTGSDLYVKVIEYLRSAGNPASMVFATLFMGGIALVADGAVFCEAFPAEFVAAFKTY